MVERPQLPLHGVQVHADYLVHGHFWLLRHLLGGTAWLSLCIDEDSGLEDSGLEDSGLLAACMGAFGERVRDRTAGVVQVRIAKERGIDEWGKELADTRKAFAAARAALPKRTDGAGETAVEPGLQEPRDASRIVARMLRELRANSPAPTRKLRQAWIRNPTPDPAEPRKHWRYVSDGDHLSDHDVAFRLRMATLAPVDKVFAMVRRRIAMFEPPVSSVRRARRSWPIYAAYEPRMVGRLREIVRVWHNWLGRSPKDGKTAAERLGLALGTVREDHILNFDLRSGVKRLWEQHAAEQSNADGFTAIPAVNRLS